MEIGRLLTAMVTPFDDEGQVDYGQAKRLALALLDSGSDGVVLAGTTGEAPTLTHDEKLRLFREVKDAVDGRGRGDRRHRDVQHGRERRAVARGGAGGRRCAAADDALLQQAAAGRHLPPLRDDRAGDVAAVHPLQHPPPHRRERDGGDDAAAVANRRTSSA